MKRRCKTRQSSSPECSSLKQENMAEDEDEPQDLKMLKEEPDNSDKTCDVSGGGLDKLPEGKPVNPSSSQVSSLPGTSRSRSFKKYKASFRRRKVKRIKDSQQEPLIPSDIPYYAPFYNTPVPPFTPYSIHGPASRLSPSLKDKGPGYPFRLTYPLSFVNQSPGQKTVTSSSQVFPLIGSPCYSTALDRYMKTRTSSHPSLGAEYSRLQSGIKFPSPLALPYTAYSAHTYRDLSRTSPSDLDKLNHPDLGKPSEKNTEPEPQSDPLLTGVGQERNEDSQQPLVHRYPSESFSHFSDYPPWYYPFIPSPIRKSAGPASRLSPRTDSSSFSSNRPSDSSDLHSRNQTSSSADLTLSPKRSSSSDTLNAKTVTCDSGADQTLLEDREPSLVSQLVSDHKLDHFWTPDSKGLTSLKDKGPGHSFTLTYSPELMYQLPGEKTVTTASSSSQVSSPFGSPCYRAELDRYMNTITSSRSSLGAEYSRLQTGIKFLSPLASPYTAYRAHTYRDLSRTSPSDLDNPNHPDLGKPNEKNTEPEPQSDPLLTGVGQERNEDSQQPLVHRYLSGSFSHFSDYPPWYNPFIPSPIRKSAEQKTVNPASSSSQVFPLIGSPCYSTALDRCMKTRTSSRRLFPSTYSGSFSSNRPSDSSDLHSRKQTSSSAIDLTLSPKSSSRDRLYIDAEVDQRDIMSEICSPLETQPSEPSQTPDFSEGRRKSSCLSHSSSSLNQIISTENSNLKRAASLPNMKLQSSFEEFTPDFTDDEEEDESYRFQCSGSGLYQCRETGLVFDMKAEGEVIYRIVPWDRRSLSQHHKKPAGPLFDISCEQQAVSRLHLPHCEIPSTGGCHFLSVAHIHNEGMDFIRPAEITVTHVIINITGLSNFGIAKDEDSPPDPVRALVLLFYKPPVEPDPEYQINVLMLPKNVVVRDVLRFRKQLDRGEMFLETPPHCKLQPKQVYTLSTSSGDDSVLVQPSEAEFDEESYDNYFTAFQVTYEKLMKHIKLFLKDSSSSSVWERRVCLSSSGVKRSCGSTRQNLCPKDLLAEIRISFIDGVSEPVLKELLDKLLQENVIHDAEKEEILVARGRRDKARRVIDTVKGKGDSASSEMIRCLCELDPFFCEHLGLM